MKLIIFLCLLFTSVLLPAQTQTHTGPGGGGPWGEGRKTCKDLIAMAVELETAYNLKLKQPYKSEKDFFSVVKDELLKKQLKELDDSTKKIKCNCESPELLEQIAQLYENHTIDPADSFSGRMELCTDEFKQRSKHLQLIKKLLE